MSGMRTLLWVSMITKIYYNYQCLLHRFIKKRRCDAQSHSHYPMIYSHWWKGDTQRRVRAHFVSPKCMIQMTINSVQLRYLHDTVSDRDYRFLLESHFIQSFVLTLLPSLCLYFSWTKFTSNITQTFNFATPLHTSSSVLKIPKNNSLNAPSTVIQIQYNHAQPYIMI